MAAQWDPGIFAKYCLVSSAIWHPDTNMMVKFVARVFAHATRTGVNSAQGLHQSALKYTLNTAPLLDCMTSLVGTA